MDNRELSDGIRQQPLEDLSLSDKQRADGKLARHDQKLAMGKRILGEVVSSVSEFSRNEVSYYHWKLIVSI